MVNYSTMSCGVDFLTRARRTLTLLDHEIVIVFLVAMDASP